MVAIPFLLGGLLLSMASCGLMRGSVPADWVLRTPPEESATSLELVVADPYCPYKLSADAIDVVVVEDRDSVTLNVAVPDTEDGSSCKFASVAFVVDVELDEPLGDRLVLNGDTDPVSPAPIQGVDFTIDGAPMN